jgi:hypothetical protein
MLLPCSFTLWRFIFLFFANLVDIHSPYCFFLCPLLGILMSAEGILDDPYAYDPSEFADEPESVVPPPPAFSLTKHHDMSDYGFKKAVTKTKEALYRSTAVSGGEFGTVPGSCRTMMAVARKVLCDLDPTVKTDATKAAMHDAIMTLVKGERDPRTTGGAVRKIVLCALLSAEGVSDKDIIESLGTCPETMTNAHKSTVAQELKAVVRPSLTSLIETVLGRDGLNRTDKLPIELEDAIKDWVHQHCRYNKVRNSRRTNVHD